MQPLPIIAPVGTGTVSKFDTDTQNFAGIAE